MDDLEEIDSATTLDELRAKLVEIVQDRLSPLALRYHYSHTSLEASIKWKPTVLILGNYSSGKSTLVNELVGANVQDTGQAPTDDSFTVITHDSSVADAPIVRDGQVLMGDPRYPFSALRRHGKRFAAHLRLKLVNAAMLENLALIDTPGMLDSVAENDRGYNYQEVIGELAQLSDLVLMIFDPHKAGTIREVYESLRETLPQKSFEDRVLFVLNRVDECESLTDLLRVYGTLCWNLSQMTGRKDIPHISITYSQQINAQRVNDHEYLRLLPNQRQNLCQSIFAAPNYRLDHLASYVELHSDRLICMLAALREYLRLRRRLVVQILFVSLAPAMLIACICYLLGYRVNPLILMIIVGLASASVFGVCFWLGRKFFLARLHTQLATNIDKLYNASTQMEKDDWQAVKGNVAEYLRNSDGRVAARPLRQELQQLAGLRDYVSEKVRRKLS